MTPRDPKPPGVPSAADILAGLDLLHAIIADANDGEPHRLDGKLTVVRKALETRVLLEEAGRDDLLAYAGYCDAQDFPPECVSLLRALARTLDAGGSDGTADD